MQASTIPYILRPYFYDPKFSLEEQLKHAAIRIGSLQKAVSYLEEKLDSTVSLLSKEEIKANTAEQRVAQLEAYMRDFLPKAQAAMAESEARAAAAEKKCAELEARMLLANATNYEQY